MNWRLIALGALLAGLSGAEARSADDLDAAGFSTVSCTGGANEIRVTVDNVRKGVGVLTIELYGDDESKWLRREGRVVRKKFAARTPQTKVCLYAPAPGDYAIGIYHDRNSSDRFDKGAFGLPAEPYGVSNNPKMRFAAPKVSEALFRVEETGPASVTVRLRGP